MASWLYERTRLWRRPLQPLSIALLLCLLMFFPPMLARQAEVKRAAIENALDSIPVSLVLSDIRGSSTEDIGLPRTFGDRFFPAESLPGGIEQQDSVSDYVADVLAKAGVCYTAEEGSAFLSSQRLVGLSGMEAERAFTHAGGRRIRWFQCEGESLFSGSREACVVPEAMLGRLEPGPDGVYRAYLRLRPYPGAETQEIGLALKVAGTHDADAMTIYCPLVLIRKVCTEMSAPMQYDSLRANVKSNRELPKLRELLCEHFAEVDPFGDRYEYARRGFYAAAIIHDERLNETVGALEKDIRTIDSIKPFLLIIECAAAGFASFFLIHARRKELAQARALGEGRSRPIVSSAAELLLLLIPGAAVKAGVFGLYAEAGAAAVVAACAVCAGALAAALSTGRRCFALLKENE